MTCFTAVVQESRGRTGCEVGGKRAAPGRAYMRRKQSFPSARSTARPKQAPKYSHADRRLAYNVLGCHCYLASHSLGHWTPSSRLCLCIKLGPELTRQVEL